VRGGGTGCQAVREAVGLQGTRSAEGSLRLADGGAEFHETLREGGREGGREGMLDRCFSSEGWSRVRDGKGSDGGREKRNRQRRGGK
jgi:hypothetical protein